MQLDWLEIIFGILTILGGGALAYRRGRRRTGPALPERTASTQKPPAERFDHVGTIEETERKRAENVAEIAADARAAGDRWRDF